MSKSTLSAIVSLFALIIICVTVLAAIGKETEQLIGIISAGLLPAIVSIFGVNQASKAKNEAKQAKEFAEKTVTNTNGRMTELIQIVQAITGDRPEGYEDLNIPELVTEDVLKVPELAPDDE